MRLLNTATKRLKTFYGNDIPPYATLSHMWGKDEDEVLFKHIAGSENDRHEGESRRGYAKIVAACEQAIKDGYGYIWIDTCCIDKESSAELSEAINSMYTWYNNSEVCYAYLEDVQGNMGTRNNEDSTFKMVPFESSRWFRRGWTLQELIAPRRVVFYSKDWVDIGTKATLQDTISSVTRIRVEMITGYDPKKASVAERMSWAAFRTTTRDEDIAYCLMGIFGVNMPLLYGEGKRAFIRLQEEIMKVSDDHSIFAWTSLINNSQEAWETRGMLANSPWNFRDAGNIVRSDDQGGSSPYSMTNQGLQIRLPLRPLDIYKDPDVICFVGDKNAFEVTLKCAYREKLTQRITIYLQMVREGCYVRIFPHWLDKTQNNPYEPTREQSVPELASLLVIQVDTSKDSGSPTSANIKILPTEFGFTFGGRCLVEGYEYSSHGHGETEIVVFDREGKSFGLGIGDDDGIPWLDFIKSDAIEKNESNAMSVASQPINPEPHTRKDAVDEIRLSYKKGGLRHNMVERHLDRLSINISQDCVVDVSVKSTHRHSSFEVVINIRRKVDEQYAPSLIKETFHTLAPSDVNSQSNSGTHDPAYKKKADEWSAAFNPKMKRVLDVNLVHTFNHESTVYCVRFSPNGEYLATGSDRAVHIYDTKTGIETCILIDKSTGNPHYLGVYSMCFSSNGQFLATGTEDKQLKIWDVTKRVISHIFSGHEKKINSLEFSLDSRLIVSGSDDWTVRIWKIADGTSTVLTVASTSTYSRDIKVESVAITPNGRFVAAGSRDGAIRIWDIETSHLVERLEKNQVHICSIAFTPDGKGLVSGAWNKHIDYWDVSWLTTGGAKGERYSSSGTEPVYDPESSSAQENADKKSRCTMSFNGHRRNVSSVAVSHDGRWILSASEQSVLFWDRRHAVAQFVLHGHNVASVTSIDMSPVGNTFATSSCQNIRIWRYDTI